MASPKPLKAAAQLKMRLYPTHIPTSTLQKAILAAGSSVAALLDPKRGDLVATSGETTAAWVLPSIRRKMKADEEGRLLLSEMPRISNATVNFDAMRSLPDGTLGREYLCFLDKLETTPDARPPVQFIDDPALVYVMQRYRETHDLYHTVLNMPTTILGEVMVKWWEGIQLGLPMAVFGGLLGSFRLFPKQRQKYLTTLLPWVIQAAPKAHFFPAVYWEKYWDVPLPELRQRLKIDEPPSL